MKIKLNSKNPNLVKWHQLNIGDCFRFDDLYYIKLTPVQEPGSCFCLSTNQMKWFAGPDCIFIHLPDAILVPNGLPKE